MQQGHQEVYQDELQHDKFRLLQVETSDTPDGTTKLLVSCRLTTHTLEEAPEYFCLSYAWNEPLASQHAVLLVISLNGHDFPVKPNLAHALLHLATHCSSRTDSDSNSAYFWIDALCINQSNTSERSAQVSVMHKIYRKALKVIVWLGPDPENEAVQVRECFRALLQKYYEEDDYCGYGDPKHHTRSTKYAYYFLHESDGFGLEAAGLPPLDAEIWLQVVRLWDRAWFFRSFTQGELVETSRLFVASGLGKTLLILKNPTPTKSIEGHLVGSSAVRYGDLQQYTAGLNMIEAEDSTQIADRMTGPARLNEHGYARNPLQRMFAQQLLMCFRDDASDPRDKVFALLVLMKQVAAAHRWQELPLKIDDSKDVRDVYGETTAWVIEETGWLGVLCLLEPRLKLQRDSKSALPSWVPDFTTMAPVPLRLFKPAGDEYVAKARDMVSDDNRPIVEGRSITVSVKRIGTVTDLGDTYTSMMDDGSFEQSAKLLLKCPAVLNCQGKTRVDWWIETLSGQQDVKPCSTKQRSQFRHWLQFYTLLKIMRRACWSS